MSERSIILRPWEARAFAEGRKTQIMRVVRPQPYPSKPGVLGYCVGDFVWPHPGRPRVFTISNRSGGPDGWDRQYSPFGRPGTVLWGRESFMPAPLDHQPRADGKSNWNIAYAAGGQLEAMAPAGYNPMLYSYERWTPSVQMPRWAARTVRRVAAVRVMRVQEIGDADAVAQGIQLGGPIGHLPSYLKSPYAYHLAQQFDADNGPGAWHVNPWVFVANLEKVR